MLNAESLDPEFPDPPIKRSLIALLLLSLALAAVTFFKAGYNPDAWCLSILVIGGVAVAYYRFENPIYYAPPLNQWLRVAILLFPIYIALQLIPLPAGLLNILSPARANLFGALTPIAHSNWAPLSVNPVATLHGLFTILTYIVLFLALREVSWRLSEHIWLPAAPLIVIAVVEAGIGMFQVLAGWPTTPATGTYANHDHFASLIGMALPFAALYPVAIFRRGKAEFSRSARSAILACTLCLAALLILAAISYSLSRMGFFVTVCSVLFIAALTVAPFLSKVGRRWAMVGLAAFAAALLIILPPVQLIHRFADLSSAGGLSGDIRVLIWQRTVRLISEFRLFGCGFGAFESPFLKYQTVAANFRISYAHNDYLQYLAELGIVGSVICAALLAGVLVQIWRGLLANSDEDRRLLVVACAGALIAVLLHDAVDFNMYIPANALTFAWIAGIGTVNALG